MPRPMYRAGLLCARISRTRSHAKQASCLHVSLFRRAYGEQREREIRSISSLLMRACIKIVERKTKQWEFMRNFRQEDFLHN